MTDFESLFLEEEKKHTPKTIAETFVEKIELEYEGELNDDNTKKSQTVEQLSRNDEKTRLNGELSQLKRRLGGLKNARNPKRVAVNNAMHALREKVRDQIKRIQDRLAVIEQEEMGAKVDPVSMVKASKEKQVNDYLKNPSVVTKWDDLL
jgi:hypothetical protein